jgi:hypothetical protein
MLKCHFTNNSKLLRSMLLIGKTCICLHELFYADEDYYVLKKTITQPSHG